MTDALRLLLFCARPRLPDDLAPELARRARRIARWSDVVETAEQHGLDALLYRHLRTAGLVPQDSGGRLRGLYLWHQTSNGVRLRALREILETFDALGIETRVLKGPALISLVYGDPADRPTADLDILVRRRDALRAQSVLQEIGYRTAGPATEASLRRHHHLPIALRRTDNIVVQVELHHDALPLDFRASLALDEAREAPTPIDVEGRPALTLGPHDMLWHLCQHLVGPLPQPLRLLSLADLTGFTAAFGNRLDWERAMRERSIVATVLALMQAVGLAPASAARHVPPAPLDELRRLWEDEHVWAWTSGTLQVHNGRVRQLARVLNPPAWWLGLRYGAPVTPPSLTRYTRRLRHLLVVSRAIRRRVTWPIRPGGALPDRFPP